MEWYTASVLESYYAAQHWNHTSTYSSFLLPSQRILDFPLPTGLHLSASRSPTSLFHSSFHLSALTSTNSPLASTLTYIFSSLPLRPSPHLHTFSVPSPFRSPPLDVPFTRTPFLLYGRLYTPTSRLDALYARRLSPTLHALVSLVSIPSISSSSAPQGSLQLSLQQLSNNWAGEYSYSMTDGMLGIKQLYTFPPSQTSAIQSSSVSSLHGSIGTGKDISNTEETSEEAGRGLKGVWSVGGELFFSLLEKSAGMSTGLRFCTLPHADQAPTIITMTLNPLMGNMSGAYCTNVTPTLSVGTRFDYNLFSYDSALALGLSYIPFPFSSNPSPPIPNGFHPPLSTTAASSLSSPSSSSSSIPSHEPPRDDLLNSFLRSPLLTQNRLSILRARISTNADAALVWEARFKKSIWSVGVKVGAGVDGTGVVRGIGVGVQYWS